MTDPINLTQLRAITYPSPTNVTAIANDTLLALIDTAEAARELDRRYDLYGADLAPDFQTVDRLRETLSRFTTE